MKSVARWFAQVALRVVLFTIPVAAGLVAQGQERTPIPEFTGQHLYVAGVESSFALVQSEIERVEAQSAQRYYAVVIRSAGAGTWAARDYIDELDRTWRKQAAERQLPLDVDRSVIMVLAVENRQLAVHAGQRLQDEFGLRGQAIDRDLVGPKFTPFARAGKYDEGLAALVVEFEAYVKAKEAEQVRQREEAAARAAQLTRDVEATLSAARQARTDLERELAERRDTGLDVTDLTSQFESTAAQIVVAEEQQAGNPASALAAGQAASQSLHSIQAELRRLTAVQHQAADRLAGLDSLVHQVSEQVDQQARKGLSVGAIQSELDKQVAALTAARASLVAKPDQAQDQAQQIDTALTVLLEQSGQLPELQQRFQPQLAAVHTLRDSVNAKLARAQQAGAATTDLQDRLQTIDARLQDADRLGQSDYVAALAVIEPVQPQLQSLTKVIDARVDNHKFRTQTLPKTIGLSAIVVLLVVVCLRRVWVRQLRKRIARELEQFVSQVVAINDVLDALQRRHQLLPYTDADYTEPMLGTTLELYQAAETALRNNRKQWLRLMDARTEAQELLDQSGPLGTKLLKAARQAIQKAGAPNTVQDIQRECAAPLDRLEQGHEEAQKLLAAGDEDIRQLPQSLEAIAAAHLPVIPYQSDVEAAAAIVAHSREVLRSDPIGAQALLAEAHAKALALKQQMEAVLRQRKRVDEVLSQRAATTDLCKRRRGEGLLLAEEPFNPDLALAESEELCRAALEELNHGHADPAAATIDRAAQAVQRAAQGIERQIAAQAKCTSELPARRAETERLRSLAGAAGGTRTELERDFAPESWRQVAGHLSQAVSSLNHGDRLTAEAATAAGQPVQHFCQAVDLLEQTQAQQRQIAALLAAIDQRLVELRDTRQRCQARISAIGRQAGQVAEFLRSNTADRPRANLHFQDARRKLEQVSAQALQPRPDWPGLQRQSEEIDTALRQSLEWAQQDVRLSDQAIQEIAAAERTVLAVKTWYSQGITADTSSAESQLNQARNSLQSQAYEQAIAQASAAQQAASTAREAAVRQAQLRQIAQEEQRRRRMELLSQSVAIGSAVSHSMAHDHGVSAASHLSPASSAPASPPSPTTTSSPASQSSWTSSSSQTSW